ncbi:MAG: hypothetical protein PVG75_07300 [Thioalkalispiraceae bacterium]|jgi:hypothetical protein
MKYITVVVLCLFTVACASNNQSSSSTESQRTSASSSSTSSQAATAESQSSTAPTSSAGDVILIAAQVPYAEDGSIPGNIRSECNLNTSLPNFMLAAAGNIKTTEKLTKNSSGKVLVMEITNARSWGNAFIGHSKAATVKGTLYDKGKKVASFTARRVSGGGFWGGFKSSCSVLNRIMKVVASDIINWLSSPVDAARLGDA